MVAILSGGAALVLPGLFCGGGMALCMWMMRRGSRSTAGDGPANTQPDPHATDAVEQGARIAALEAEVARLRG
ncbi:MAG: hypothetical protein ACYDD6_03065 [Acidimicrobiales bacterium]